MRLRPTLVLATLTLAMIATVQPAAAFTELGTGGTYYVPQVTDEPAMPGVGCIYNDNDGTRNDTLKRLKVREFFTHAPYAKMRYVGFRVTILRNGLPYETTPMVKKLASQVNVAFFKASWLKPAGLSGSFQAVVKLTFFNSQGVAKGTYRGRMDVYKQNLGATGWVDGDAGDPGVYTDTAMPGSCYAKYQAPD